MTDEFDIIIKNAYIVDGTGAPGYKGILAVKDQRIAALSKTGVKGDATRVIDAQGMAVTPGFIDVHNHGDLSILYYPKAEGFVHQGITTFVGGQCGDSPGPFGDWIGLPWVLGDVYDDIDPRMYFKNLLQPRDVLNQRHKELYGWEIDWRTMGEFFSRVEKTGISPNYVPLVGHGDIRSLVMRQDFKRVATDVEIKQMVEHTEQAMLDGCRGVSVGRDYDPGIYAEFKEILACAEVSAKYGGVYASHSLRTGHRKPRRPGEFSPNKSKGVLEAIDIGRKAKLPVQVSHLGVLFDVTPGDEKLAEEALRATLRLIDDARDEGLDVNFDEIPHHLTGGLGTSPWLIHSLKPWLKIAGSPEQFAEALLMGEFREEIKEKIWAGKHYSLNPNINPRWASSGYIAITDVKENLDKTVAQIAKETGVDELDALFNILMADPYTRYERRSEDDSAKLEFYKHPAMMIGIDAFAVDTTRQSHDNPPSYPNQNSYGGFACYLRRSVREAKIMSIEEAVKKITGNPAEKFKLTDRGVIREGAYADITIWNPETITDKGNQIEPRQLPEGIPYVIINGEIVIKDGVHTGVKPGLVLRRE